jgi:hypothetical protein
MIKGGRLPRYEYFCSATTLECASQYIVATFTLAKRMKMCVCTSLVQLGTSKEIYKQKQANWQRIGSSCTRRFIQAPPWNNPCIRRESAQGPISRCGRKYRPFTNREFFWSGTLIGDGRRPKNTHARPHAPNVHTDEPMTRAASVFLTDTADTSATCMQTYP